MSWFGSIVNSLRLDDEENDAVSGPEEQQQQRLRVADDDDDDDSASQSDEGQHGGVKEDLSQITKTLTRQLWGVASFLAPPPPQSPTEAGDRDGSETAPGAGIDGIRSDFAEIGGRFKSGITKLSGGAKAVSELSKMASSFLQLGLDQGGGLVGEYGGSAVGVTEEVVAFAKNVSMHPETWLDFPLADDDGEQDDFDMSDAQQEHALAVERLVPELAALRFDLCPEYISEDLFWKIYFVLVHPRLAKHDADLISTPQILETRAMLTRELQNQRERAVEPDISEGNACDRKEYGASSHEASLSIPSNTQPETPPSASESAHTVPPASPTENSAVSIKDIPVVDKSVVKEEASKAVLQAQRSSSSAAPSSPYVDEDDGDDWLKEEMTEAGTGGSGTGSGINIPITNDEDVSFSDLEEEDDVPTGAKKATYGSDSSTKSRDWVQLSRNSSDSAKDNKLSDGKHNGSPNKEANDWLNVEDIDEM